MILPNQRVIALPPSQNPLSFSQGLAGQLHESEKKINWLWSKQQPSFGCRHRCILEPFLYRLFPLVRGHSRSHPQQGHQGSANFLIYGEVGRRLVHYIFPCNSSSAVRPHHLPSFNRYTQWPTRWGLVVGSNRCFCRTWWRISLHLWYHMQGQWNWYHLRSCRQADGQLLQRSIRSGSLHRR